MESGWSLARPDIGLAVKAQARGERGQSAEKWRATAVETRTLLPDALAQFAFMVRIDEYAPRESRQVGHREAATREISK